MNLQIPTENQEQRAVMQWWASYSRICKIPEELLIHIANERKTSSRQGAYLKAMGVRSGVPDLFLALPCGQCHGLWIEMKRRKGGRVSKSQDIMHAILKASGYGVHVCYGAEEAMNAIRAYVAFSGRKGPM